MRHQSSKGSSKADYPSARSSYTIQTALEIALLTSIGLGLVGLVVVLTSLVLFVKRLVRLRPMHGV